MQTFAEFRKRRIGTAITETVRESTETAAVPLDELERLIDQFIAQLKQQLVNPTTGPDAQRGVWDRMKNWWSNMWHGRYNQQNPYFWKNKLGDDLGRQAENVDALPLEHFMVLQEQSLALELALPQGAEGLQVVRIVDQWALQFKKAVMGLISRMSGSTPRIPEGPATEPKQPAETPPVDKGAEKPPVDKGPAEKPPVVPKDAEGSTDPLKEIKDKLNHELDQMQDSISFSAYRKFKNDIETASSESQLNMIGVMLSKKRVSPMEDPVTAKTTDPVASTPAVVKDALPPKPEKRPWNELSAHERHAWDEAGGGDSTTKTAALKSLGIDTIPWILRIGDPRLEAIRGIRNKALYHNLAKQRRIENQSNPIETKDQLQKAVEDAKQQHDKFHDELRKKKNTVVDTDATPPVTPEKVETPPESAPVVDPVADRTAPLAPTVSGDTGSSTGSDRKAALDVGGGVEKKKRKSRRLPRVGGMEIPGHSTEKIDPKVLDADLETVKDHLDDDIYQRMKSWIAEGKPDQLEYVKDQVGALKKKMERSKPESEERYSGEEGSGVGDMIETTIKDHTAFVVSNFKHRVNETNKDCSIFGEQKKKSLVRKR